MTDAVIHPGLVLIAGAMLLPLLGGLVRSIAVVGLPLLALAFVWQVPDGPAWQLQFLEYTISPLQGDKLSRLFGTIFALMAADYLPLAKKIDWKCRPPFFTRAQR